MPTKLPVMHQLSLSTSNKLASMQKELPAMYIVFPRLEHVRICFFLAYHERMLSRRFREYFSEFSMISVCYHEWRDNKVMCRRYFDGTSGIPY